MSLYVFMNTYMCYEYIYTYMHALTKTDKHTNRYTHLRIHTDIHTNTQISRHTYIDACMHVCTYTYKCILTCVSVFASVCVYACMYTRVCMHQCIDLLTAIFRTPQTIVYMCLSLGASAGAADSRAHKHGLLSHARLARQGHLRRANHDPARECDGLARGGARRYAPPCHPAQTCRGNHKQG